MDTKDLIIIAGSIFFALIIGHGLWVARRSRANDIRMDLRAKKIGDLAEDYEPPSSELPNGGARVISQALQAEAADESGAVENAVSPGGSQTTLQAQNKEPYVSSTAPERTATEPLTDDLFATTSAQTRGEPPVTATAGASSSIDVSSAGRSATGSEAEAAKEMKQEIKQETKRQITPPREPTLEELLILGVMAKSGRTFGGEELIEALRAQGLKFGDMGIFHRQESGTSGRSYSVANALEPGTFDLSDLESLQTPGLTFFLQLPVPGDALETLDEMILSARAVAATLGGDVKDDTMSALTGQTIEHMKQRIADFARKQLTNASGH